MLMHNNIYKNLNKKIYIANKSNITNDDYNNEIINYNKPFYLGMFNYQPLYGEELEAYMSAYGETKNKLVKVFLDTKYRNKLKEFDVAYLYGKTPKNEEIYGEDANYIIRICSEQNTKIMVVFEEIIKEEE